MSAMEWIAVGTLALYVVAIGLLVWGFMCAPFGEQTERGFRRTDR